MPILIGPLDCCELPSTEQPRLAPRETLAASARIRETCFIVVPHCPHPSGVVSTLYRPERPRVVLGSTMASTWRRPSRLRASPQARVLEPGSLPGGSLLSDCRHPQCLCRRCRTRCRGPHWCG